MKLVSRGLPARSLSSCTNQDMLDTECPVNNLLSTRTRASTAASCSDVRLVSRPSDSAWPLCIIAEETPFHALSRSQRRTCIAKEKRQAPKVCMPRYSCFQICKSGQSGHSASSVTRRYQVHCVISCSWQKQAFYTLQNRGFPAFKALLCQGKGTST